MNEKEIAKEIRTLIKKGDAAGVAAIISLSKSYLGMMTPFGTWLHVAASAGHLEVVKCLVSLGADINARGGILKGAAINEAASKGHVEIVKYLLACGAKIDISGPEVNPLFSAIYSGQLQIVKLLIESGINSKIRYTGTSMKDMDALAFAKERGQAEIAVYLLNYTK